MHRLPLVATIEETDEGSVVTLTAGQLLLGGYMAVMQIVQNIQRDRREQHGTTLLSQDNRIVSNWAEQAVAVYKNVFWDGNLGNIRASDVGVDQVKCAPYPDRDVWCHKDSRDDDRFILVTMSYPEGVPTFTICGWAYGIDIKRKGEKRTYRKNGEAFYLDRRALVPLERG